MNITILRNKLDSIFSEHSTLMAGPASANDIRLLEIFAGFALPEVYKWFLASYGSAIVGAYSVYGIGRAAAMAKKEGSAITMTESYRSEGWLGIEAWLIISSNFWGGPIGLIQNGSVWSLDQEFNVVEELSPTFKLFLEQVCLGSMP